MRISLVFLVFLINLYVFGQDSERKLVHGEIAVERNDLEGIVIRNKSSNVFVITNEKGEFTLKVRLNDVIEVSALQYHNITFNVNEAIIKSGVMKIYLIEEINQLEEVVVSNNKLSGNLKRDIKTVSGFKSKQDIFYFGINKEDNVAIEQVQRINETALNTTHNVSMNPERQNMINGLNIINVVDQLLLPLFRSEVRDKKDSGVPAVPVESIKHYFGSKFLEDNFNIPEHRVEEFIHYAQSDNFDYALLGYGMEMQLLEYLYIKSLDFLGSKK